MEIKRITIVCKIVSKNDILTTILIRKMLHLISHTTHKNIELLEITSARIIQII